MSGGAPDEGRSLLLHAPRQLGWVRELLPPLGPHDLLIETIAGAISSGTELPHYRGDSRDLAAPRYPRMTGYESVGIVRACGAATVSPALGSRVVATYGHRTHAVVPAVKAVPVPDSISDAAALLLILSGDVATGIAKLGGAPPEPILVTGAGAIGLLSIFVLAALGATAIDLIEPLADRRELAHAFGARRAVGPEMLDRLEPEYASGVECSSRDAAFGALQARLRPHGRLCILADGNLEPLTLAPHFHQQQLSVVGSSDCPDYHAHARWYFPLAALHQATLERLFDCRVAATELSTTFAALASGTLLATKVLVSYEGKE